MSDCWNRSVCFNKCRTPVRFAAILITHVFKQFKKIKKLKQNTTPSEAPWRSSCLHACLPTWLAGSPPACLHAWLAGCVPAWSLACLVAWLHVWLPAYLAAWPPPWSYQGVWGAGKEGGIFFNFLNFLNTSGIKHEANHKDIRHVFKKTFDVHQSDIAKKVVKRKGIYCFFMFYHVCVAVIFMKQTMDVLTFCYFSGDVGLMQIKCFFK